MEISKENVFRATYAPVLGQSFNKHKKRTSSIIKFIRNNKILTTVTVIFFMCVSLNFILIYNFMKILENM